MSLTLNTSPSAIANNALFSIVTSLTEDSTHVNLRVRADITVSAVVIATVEKPKGISSFDFSEILKSQVTGISFARDSGDLYKVSGGSPLVAYTILFTEVYEDAAGATQTEDTENASGATFRYVPCDGDPDLAFAEYVLHDATSRFASKTLRNTAVKFYTAVPLEYWLTFFTSVANVELFYSKDGGAWDHATHMTVTDGWGVIIINIGELMASVNSNLRIQLGEVGGAKISEIITIYVDTSSIDERTVLEFDGVAGGKEYLAFEGIKDKTFQTKRDYYEASAGNRKPLHFKGTRRQRLETRLKDMDNTAYLEDLLMSEIVKKLEASYATPTDVTVVSDSVKTAHTDMFTNPIEIEYAR